MYTRPFAIESPPQWLHDSICSPLDHNSFPVCASSAYNTACVEPLIRFSAELYASPMSYAAWFVSSPLPYANTIPLAITGGSARFMSRETHAGDRSHFPFFSSTLNAAIAPFLTGPYSIGARNFECFGPQKGVNTQRVPFESSQLAIEPRRPPRRS